jgi:uncharacterized membrane protein YhaH (DUF805 family)
MSEANSPWQILDKIYTLFTANPLSFLAVLVVWIMVTLVFQRGLHVHISPWIALLTLIVSVGIVIGIILSFF